MSSPFEAAVHKAAAIILSYSEKCGETAFPTIKGGLWPIIEDHARLNGVDRVVTQRFNEPMRPVVGQARRMHVQTGAYKNFETHGMIYLCPTLELDWQRWVQMKEAAHLLLDKPGDFVTDDDGIDKLLTSFAQFDLADVGEQFMSEMRAMVFANEILFPFATRAKLKKQYDAGEVAPGVIAGHAGIPTQIVRHVMSGSYWSVIERINTAMVKDSVAGKLKIAKA